MGLVRKDTYNITSTTTISCLHYYSHLQVTSPALQAIVTLIIHSSAMYNHNSTNSLIESALQTPI